EVYVGIAVESADDFVVVQLHGLVPAVDELCEVRERETLHQHARLNGLATVLGHDLDCHPLDARSVRGRSTGQHGLEATMALVEREMSLQSAAVEELVGLAHEPACQDGLLRWGERRDQHLGRWR